jgi:hypothetical protein
MWSDEVEWRWLPLSRRLAPYVSRGSSPFAISPAGVAGQSQKTRRASAGAACFSRHGIGAGAGRRAWEVAKPGIGAGCAPKGMRP